MLQDDSWMISPAPGYEKQGSSLKLIDKSSVSDCTKCTIKFSIVIKKHNCRECGKVFCGSCSSMKNITDNNHTVKRLRLCNTCANNMDKSKLSKVTLDSIKENLPVIQNQKETRSSSKEIFDISKTFESPIGKSYEDFIDTSPKTDSDEFSPQSSEFAKKSNQDNTVVTKSKDSEKYLINEIKINHCEERFNNNFVFICFYTLLVITLYILYFKQ